MADNEALPQDVERLILIEALWNIAHDTEEVETLRLSLGGLLATPGGKQYLDQHPINF